MSKFQRLDSGLFVPDDRLVRSRPFAARHVRRHPNCGASCCEAESEAECTSGKCVGDKVRGNAELTIGGIEDDSVVHCDEGACDSFNGVYVLPPVGDTTIAPTTGPVAVCGWALDDVTSDECSVRAVRCGFYGQESTAWYWDGSTLTKAENKYWLLASLTLNPNPYEEVAWGCFFDESQDCDLTGTFSLYRVIGIASHTLGVHSGYSCNLPAPAYATPVITCQLDL